MKYLAKILGAAVISASLFVGNVKAATPPAYYQPPTPSTTTGQAIMWISGNIEVHKSTNDKTSLIVLSSTGGVTVTYGIVVTTLTINDLLAGTKALFSSWIVSSSATIASSATIEGIFFSTISGTRISFSTMIARGVVYNWPPSQGSASTVLTNDGSGNLSWAAASGGGTVGNSTYPIVLKYDGYVYGSTNGISGIPGMYTCTSNSTITVVSIQVSVLKNSTAGITATQIKTSSGGLTDLPVTATFPRIDIATGTSTGAGGYTGNVSTVAVINAGTCYGAQVLSTYPSGTPAYGLEITLWVWRKPYESP